MATSRSSQSLPALSSLLRSSPFAFLTLFFFIKGGLNVSLAAVFANLGLLAAFLAAKMLPKIAFIFPLAQRAAPRHATFTTLLMSIGLTFGTISSLYGLYAGIIDETQSRSSSPSSSSPQSCRPRSPSAGSSPTPTRRSASTAAAPAHRQRSTSRWCRRNVTHRTPSNRHRWVRGPCRNRADRCPTR